MGITASACLVTFVRPSNGGLRADPEHESVGAGLDDLLRDDKVRESLYGAQERHLALPQLEGAALGEVAIQGTLRHQGPVLQLAELAIVLKKCQKRENGESKLSGRDPDKM